MGLRHNIDCSPIVTSTKFLAMVHYITNYATKLNTPKYERLAMAGEIMAKSDAVGSDANDVRSFFVKAANRIFTDRELSAVEVKSHLLGYSHRLHQCATLDVSIRQLTVLGSLAAMAGPSEAGWL